jgi:hypothetical protein
MCTTQLHINVLWPTYTKANVPEGEYMPSVMLLDLFGLSQYLRSLPIHQFVLTKMSLDNGISLSFSTNAFNCCKIATEVAPCVPTMTALEEAKIAVEAPANEPTMRPFDKVKTAALTRRRIKGIREAWCGTSTSPGLWTLLGSFPYSSSWTLLARLLRPHVSLAISWKNSWSIQNSPAKISSWASLASFTIWGIYSEWCCLAHCHVYPFPPCN